MITCISKQHGLIYVKNGGGGMTNDHADVLNCSPFVYPLGT